MQDNCPCQTSAFAKASMEKTHHSELNLPPKSADEHCVKTLRQSEKQATDEQITKESNSELETQLLTLSIQSQSLLLYSVYA